MNRTLTNFVIFAIGSVIGSIVTWKLVKDKYKRDAQEEIDIIRSSYAKREKERLDVLRKMNDEFKETQDRISKTLNNECKNEGTEHDSAQSKVATIAIQNDGEYDNIVNIYNKDNESIYKMHGNVVITDDDGLDEDEDAEEAPEYIAPRAITYEEYCDGIDYNTCPMTFYEGDKCLVNDWDEVQNNVDDLVGWENIENFLETDEDVLYVRNELTKLDYEITRDPRSWFLIPGSDKNKEE